ncbi:MAG: hypothetical protein AAB553_03780 [Patescibacteria group bacterium]
MDIYTQLANKIIKEQETIIGPIAWEQAAKVSGLSVDVKNHQFSIVGTNKKEIIEKLVEQYKLLFGQTSVEVSKDAVKDLILSTSRDQLPQILL